MTLEQTLLDKRLNDFEKYSAAMPVKAKMISKVFAKTIGASSGKALLAYDSMLTNMAKGESIQKINSDCSKILDNESKVKFFKFDARLCSILALNHSGFMGAEANLYKQLFNDLQGKDINSGNIEYELRSLGVSNTEKYTGLLQDKTQSIYDFGVLMGTNKDKNRLNELTGVMHGKFADYFNKAVKLHNGNALFSWPIPFKNYSGTISEMLYHDSTSHALQEGTSIEFGFKNPQVHDSRYALILDEINNVFKEKKFKSKWQAAKMLPAYAFYMSGLNAYASSIGENTDKHPDYLGAATTAGLIASTIAGDDKKNRDQFVTTFLTLFTTTLG